MPLEAGALKIIYLSMDCSADGLYRANLEAPIIKVIDEALEESGVRGVLVGPHDLERWLDAWPIRPERLNALSACATYTA